MEFSEAANRILTSNSTLFDQRTLISLVGAIDVELTARLDREFAEAAWVGVPQVTGDMSHLQLIDEEAIYSVLRGIETLRASGADLDIRYPSPMALQLFEMCASHQISGIEFALASWENLSDRARSRSTDEFPTRDEHSGIPITWHRRGITNNGCGNDVRQPSRAAPQRATGNHLSPPLARGGTGRWA